MDHIPGESLRKLRESSEKILRLTLGYYDVEDDFDPAIAEWGTQLFVPFKIWIPEGFNGPELRITTFLPDYRRLDINALWEVVQTLPDFGIFQAIMVVDRPHQDQFRRRRELDDETLTIRVAADGDGNVLLYRPDDANLARADLCNIFSMLFKESERALSLCFDEWWEYEPIEFVGADTRTEDADESWGFLGQLLLAPDPSDGLLSASTNHVLAAIWGTAFLKTLESTPAERRSPRHEHYLKLAQYLTKDIGAEARQELRSASDADDAKGALAETCLQVLSGDI